MKISCMCTFNAKCPQSHNLMVHMHESFIVCYKTCFCFFQSLIDTIRNTVNIFENILKIRTDIRSFRSLPVFADSVKAWLSVVAENAELNSALSS